MDTFVIRVWLPADEQGEGPPDGLRGIVEHVSDGRLMVFDGAEELLTFLTANRGAPTPG